MPPFAALYLISGLDLSRIFCDPVNSAVSNGGRSIFLAGMIMFAIARFQGAPNTDPRDVAGRAHCRRLSVALRERWGDHGGGSGCRPELAAPACRNGPNPYRVAPAGSRARRRAHHQWSGLGTCWRLLSGSAFWSKVRLQARSDSPPLISPWGCLSYSFGSLIWSVGSLYSRKAKNAPSPFLAAGQQMLCGAVLPLFWLALCLASIAVLIYTTSHGFRQERLLYLVVIGVLVGFPGAYIFLFALSCDLKKSGDLCAHQPGCGPPCWGTAFRREV